jgi:hypothetical protein
MANDLESRDGNGLGKQPIGSLAQTKRLQDRVPAPFSVAQARRVSATGSGGNGDGDARTSLGHRGPE